MMTVACLITVIVTYYLLSSMKFVIEYAISDQSLQFLKLIYFVTTT